jgi:hypothetical protein
MITLLAPFTVFDAHGETDDALAAPSVAAEKSAKQQLETEKFWIRQPRGLQAFAEIDVANPVGPVNKLIFGACSWWPPSETVDGKTLYYEFGPGAYDAVEPFLGPGSMRFWHHGGDGPKEWDDIYITFHGKVKPARVYAFNNKGHRNRGKDGEFELVRYGSETDNNLYPYQQPKAWADAILSYNNKPRREYPNGIQIKHWELWNEPTFPSNGKWDAEEHAQWCLDTARHLKNADPSLRIGPHMYSPAKWNRTLLEYLNKHDKDGLIDFIVTHYYDTKWFQQWETYGSYLGKVAYSTEMRKLIDRDVKMVRDIAGDKWPLVCTEWNNHPARYDWPGEPTRDLGVALFQASSLMAFTKGGFEAAQVFSMRSGQFGLFRDADAKIKWPTLYVFDLYGRYFNGQRLPSETVSPSFAWNWKTKTGSEGQPREVPYVETMASYDKGQVVIMAINKHPKEPVHLNIKLKGYDKPVTTAFLETLTAKHKDDTDAILNKERLEIKQPLVIKLPQHSFSAITLR